MTESGSDIEYCYACGSEMGEGPGTMDIHTRYIYCDDECAKSERKYIAPLCDDDMIVPVRGKCKDGSAIYGRAEFDIHGTVHIVDASST